MYSLMVFVALAIAGINAQGGAPEPAPKVDFIFLSTFKECEGKDSGNYTGVQTQETDAQCSQSSVTILVDALIALGPNGERSVIQGSLLAASRYPDGAYEIVDQLNLATSGPLSGKYVFIRSRHLVRDYLKKCSSVLGLSAIVIKTLEMLISDKLSPEVLIDPKGAYEAFKKGCTTVCRGQAVGV